MENKQNYIFLTFSDVANFVKNSRWKEEMFNIILELNKDEFTLNDVYNFLYKLQDIFTDSNNVSARCRRTLQEFRDADLIEFIGKGQYRVKFRLKIK